MLGLGVKRNSGPSRLRASNPFEAQGKPPHSQGDTHSCLVSILAKELREVNRIFGAGGRRTVEPVNWSGEFVEEGFHFGAGVLVAFFSGGGGYGVRGGVVLRGAGVAGARVSRRTVQAGGTLLLFFAAPA